VGRIDGLQIVHGLETAARDPHAAVVRGGLAEVEADVPPRADQQGQEQAARDPATGSGQESSEAPESHCPQYRPAQTTTDTPPVGRSIPCWPMPLIYAGIDEAGYGPLLGPLCVGLSVFRVEEWEAESAAPDLWKLLNSGVCRKPGDRRRRIAVDDSKALKLPNDSPTAHPLTHLERGVLSFLGVADGAAGGCPAHDEALFLALKAAVPSEPWYVHPTPLPCPATTTAEAVGISINMLRTALERAGVGVLSLKCRVFGESVYNELVQAGGSKAAATEAALVDHLWMVWDNWAHAVEAGNAVRVVCDRQGGREQYGELLQRAFPGATVEETHRTWQQSRYELTGVGTDGEARHMHVLFLVESERAHLPVALASMAAKLTRESMMARFNRYWCARMPELKPTAGYRGDAWRWLEDARGIIADDERAVMIRRS
jgi:hypothetical protein